jgi:hypothetical protein
MIICYVCKISKQETEFHKNNKMCKSCKKEYMKSRYDSNKEEITERKKNSILKHPETLKNYTDTYYKENKVALNKMEQSNRLDPIKYLGRLVIESKNRAKERSLDFDLDKDFVLQLYEGQDKKCSISGIQFDFQKDSEFRIRPWAPSIDRINPKLGYVKSNVRLVCIVANLAINQFGDFIFDKMCRSYVANKS